MLYGYIDMSEPQWFKHGNQSKDSNLNPSFVQRTVVLGLVTRKVSK